MGSLAAGLFFLRFWRQSRDRLFLIFGVSFFIFAVNRFLLALVDTSSEATTYIYMLRLAAFVLILLAIVDKNIGSAPQRGETKEPG